MNSKKLNPNQKASEMPIRLSLAVHILSAQLIREQALSTEEMYVVATNALDWADILIHQHNETLKSDKSTEKRSESP